MKKKQSRKDNSLSNVTIQIMDILKSKKEIDIKELSHITCKRRCYDVVLVLEALSIIERKSKGFIKLIESDESSVNKIDDNIIDNYFSE
jgi:hypothetical protein